MKNAVVTSGATTCLEPGCGIAIVLVLGKNATHWCFDHMPSGRQEAEPDRRPLKGRIQVRQRDPGSDDDETTIPAPHWTERSPDAA